MDGTFGRKSRRRGPTINITPLIDVMFLLLIFFMVSSTFRHSLGIDVQLPEADTATEQEMPPHEIIVRDNGEYHVGGNREAVSLEEVRAFLRDLKSNNPDVAVVLQPDPTADFNRVLDVIDAARGVGSKQLVIPTKPRASPEAGTDTP